MCDDQVDLMAPLTPAEKQKRYRDRLRQTYPEKYSTILKNNAERNRKYRKKVKESTTTEEKNKQRLKWREKKRTERKKDSNNTASDEERKFTQQRAKRRIYRMWIAKKAQYESKINVLNKTVNRLRKQNARLMKKLAQFEELLRHPEDTEENIITPEPNENNMTPLSKSCAFIDQNLPNVTSEEKEKVKRVLLDHNILTNAVQDAYKNTKSNNERNIFKKITEHEYVTKYKMKRKVSLILGLKGRARRLKQYENKRNKKTVEEIRQFYERDDVSRATAGKKEVKTSKKEKRQRRYLLKTQKDLFKKYKDEGGTAKYSTFKKHRPFYVLHPKLSNRDTCACVKHENFILKTEKLHTLAMIDTKNVEDILAKVMCDPNSKDCAYRQCSTCRDNDITFDWAGYSKDEMVMWEEFAREKHEYVDKNSGHNKTTEKMVKREKSGTMVSLTDSYNSDLNTFSKHVYNIKHQYSQYVSCIKNLTTNEVVVHIDFSENYTCKYAKEVQTMHWGASKPQITIHTGVIYAKNKEPQTFASISPNNEHGPEAIWAHLTPILQYIRKILPNITGIHFFSDGPTSQYKQKKNFYFFSKLMEEMGFPNSTWNFSEASHGKGAADGVGAAVKRRLDNCVSQGMDVPNAETAYDILQNSDSSVLTFYVPQDSIQNFSVDADLIPVPQTMTLHQIVKTESVNTIRYRCLSCFCCDMISFKGSCNCLNIKYHKLYNEQKQRQPTASIREGEKNSLEMDGFEKKKKIPKKTIKTEKTVRNKIQMLSDVRYLPENQSYIDMNKFDASKFITIPVETDLLRSKKNKTPDDIYKTPVPSTSKEGLMATKKSEQKNLKRKRPQFSDDSTDTDTENFSVHDSSDYCYEEEFLDEEFLDEELLRLPIEQNEIKTTGPGKRNKIGGKRTRKYDEIIMSESSGTTHESFERSGPEKLRKHLEQPCLTPSTSHDSLKRSGPANAQKDPEEVHQRRRGTSHDSLEDFEPENAQIDPVETGQPKETSLQSPSTSHETFERSGPENFRKHLEEPCLTTGTSHESLKRSGPANAQKDPEEVYQRRRGTSHDSLEDFGPENAQIDTVETGQPKETSLQSPSTSHETFERSGPENLRKHLEEPCLTPGTSHDSLKRSGAENSQDHLKTTSLTPGVPHNSSDMTPIKKKVSIDGLVIPSPFKRNLFWPDEIDSKKKKRKIKEKIPSAIGSSAWRNYHQNKESEKQRKIAEKERRAEERKEKLKKKEEQEKQKKKKMGKKQSYEPISSDDTDMEVKYSKSDDSPYDVEMDVSSSSKKLPYSETKRKSKEAAILSGSDSDDMPLCRLSVNTEKTKGISKGCYVIITYEGEYFPGVVENVDRDYFEVSTMTFSTGNTYRWPDKPDKIWYAKKDILEKIENPVLCNKRGFYTVKEMEKFLTFTT